MADMDWGWKRKKRTGQDLEQSDNEIISEEELDDLLGLLYQNSVENEDALDESKRNIASVRNHGLDKKSVAALARNNNLVDHEEKRDSVDTNEGKLLCISDKLSCSFKIDIEQFLQIYSFFRFIYLLTSICPSSKMKCSQLTPRNLIIFYHS